MSLIIDALKKAQQLRLSDAQRIPFFKTQQPPRGKKTAGLGKRWLFPIVAFCCLLFILWIVVWNPLPFFHGGKQPLLSVALPQKNRPSVLTTEKRPEEPVGILPSSFKEPEVASGGAGSPETRKDEHFLKQPDKKQTPKTANSIGRPTVKKPLSPPAQKASQSLRAAPPSTEETVYSPPEETREITKPLLPPVEVLTLFNEGVHYQNQKEAAKAIQVYQKVIELDPAYFEAYNNLGLLYQEMGDFEQAYQAYQRSIEINPRYEKALNNLGILSYLKDRDEEALAFFQKAIAVHPENKESYLNLGILFKKQGQLDKAIESFQKALVIDPLHGETHYNLALLYEQMSQFKLAIDHYQKFMHLSSKTYPVLVSKVQRHLDALYRMKREKNK